VATIPSGCNGLESVLGATPQEFESLILRSKGSSTAGGRSDPQIVRNLATSKERR
jgi:hypothetical protein